MGLYPLLKTRCLSCDPAPVLEIKSWQDFTSPCPSGNRVITIAGAVMVYILQTVHVDGAGAIFDGVADVLGDDDRSSIRLLVTTLAYGKEFAAE